MNAIRTEKPAMWATLFVAALLALANGAAEAGGPSSKLGKVRNEIAASLVPGTAFYYEDAALGDRLVRFAFAKQLHVLDAVEEGLHGCRVRPGASSCPSPCRDP